MYSWALSVGWWSMATQTLDNSLNKPYTVGPDAYPFYENEEQAVRPKRAESPGFDDITSIMYKAVTAAKVAPNKLVTTDRLGRFPFSSIPQIPTAVTNRAETAMYKLYVEDDGALSYDVTTTPSLNVTNRAGTIIYKLYIEDDGAVSYDVSATVPIVRYVTNRAGTIVYRLYVEDDGAISYDIL